MKLGGLHEELGEMVEAENCYRRALAIRPQAPAPLACLATLLRGKLPDADRDSLRDRLDDLRLDVGPRGNLLFGLAHACDARGDHAEAAACLRTCQRPGPGASASSEAATTTRTNTRGSSTG